VNKKLKTTIHQADAKIIGGGTNKKCIFAGRFRPFHNGHLAAIKWMLDNMVKYNAVVRSLEDIASLVILRKRDNRGKIKLCGKLFQTLSSIRQKWFLCCWLFMSALNWSNTSLGTP
jgi:hypothetical protein